MTRRRTAIIVLAACLAAGAGTGLAIAAGRDSTPTLDASLDTPGTFDLPGDPGGGIPTAPDLAGREFPALTMTTLDGATVAPDSLIGQPAVVNLWYSTCLPCAKELPAFAAVHRQLGNEVRFVGLNLQDPPDRAAKFAERAGVGFEVLLGKPGEVARSLDVLNFPATLFVDPSGQIVELHQGALTEAELTAAISKYLGVA